MLKALQRLRSERFFANDAAGAIRQMPTKDLRAIAAVQHLVTATVCRRGIPVKLTFTTNSHR
jgi:hypothetical protein